MLTTVQTVTYWCETSLTGVVHLLLVIAILVTAYKFTYGVSAGSKSSVTETMQRGDSIAPNPQMESHLMRLATFRSLPESASLSPSMASKAGLYYTGEGDTVACYSCGLRLNHLESGVQPMTVHRQLSPECQFVVSQQSHSAPIGGATRQGRSAPVQVSQTAVNSRTPEQMSTDDIMSHTSRQPVQVTSSEGVSQAVSTNRAPVQVTTSEDVSQDIPTSRAPEETILPSRNRNRHRGPRRRPNSRPNYYSMLASVAGGGSWSAYVDNSRSSQPSSRHYDTVDGLTHIMDRINDISDSPGTGHLSGMVDSPTHFAERVNNNDPTLLVEMKYERRRFATYSNWPRDVVNISPEALAQAGLFYLGLADRVKCPFCGGILRNWEPSDEPMREHRRNFPHCIFVRDARAAGNVAIGEEPTLTQTLTNTTSGTSASGTSASSTSASGTSASGTASASAVTTTEAAASAADTAPELTDTGASAQNPTMTCKVCLDAEMNTLFLPCGHLACCSSCAVALSTCPICRHIIEGRVRTYMS